MENNNKITEYYCTKCNAQVNENDSSCKNCGADLTEIVQYTIWQSIKDKILSFVNKFRNYHRISFYLFLGPLLILISNILLAIFYITYSELFRDPIESMGLNYIFNYFSYIIVAIPILLPVFVFTHLYLNIKLKLKIIITISVILLLFMSTIIFKLSGLNNIGIIPLTIILLELTYLRYTKRDYIILAVASILFIGWFQFLSLGALPINVLMKDYKKITKPLKVIKVEVEYVSTGHDYGIPDNQESHDMSITYIIATKKDTQQLVLNYDKIRDNSIPSQHWKLVDWEIDTVFGHMMYYPKPKF